MDEQHDFVESLVGYTNTIEVDYLVGYLDSEIGFHFGFISALSENSDNFDLQIACRRTAATILNTVRLKMVGEENIIFIESKENDDDDDGNDSSDEGVTNPPSTPPSNRDAKDIERLDKSYPIPDNFKLKVDK